MVHVIGTQYFQDADPWMGDLQAQFLEIVGFQWYAFATFYRISSRTLVYH